MQKITMLFLLIAQVFAAPAISSSLCEIQGEVTSVKTRVQKFGEKQKSWRQEWGVLDSINYTDVTLKLKKVKTLEASQLECNIEDLQAKTFQLRRDVKPELKKGECFKAKTQFSGDEFSHGQWLWDIEYDCE